MTVPSHITIDNILNNKGRTVHVVNADTCVYDALEVMARYGIGGVPVMDTGKIVGMFTERDYARKVALKGHNSRDARVSEMMTRQVVTTTPRENLFNVMNMMTVYRFRHLPVMDEGRLVGMITIGDVVKAVIENQQETISQLSGYIAGDLNP